MNKRSFTSCYQIMTSLPFHARLDLEHVGTLSGQCMQWSCPLPPDHQLCKNLQYRTCPGMPEALSVFSGHSLVPGVSGWLATPASHLWMVSLRHSYTESSKSCCEEGERSHQTLVAFKLSQPLITAPQWLLQDLGQLLPISA